MRREVRCHIGLCNLELENRRVKVQIFGKLLVVRTWVMPIGRKPRMGQPIVWLYENHAGGPCWTLRRRV